MIVIKREAISEAGFRPCSTEGPKGGGAVRCGGCPTSLPAPTETKTALLDNSRKACCEILLGSLILTGRECWARHKWERIIPQCKMYKPNLKYLSPTRRESTRKSTRFFFILHNEAASRVCFVSVCLSLGGGEDTESKEKNEGLFFIQSCPCTKVSGLLYTGFINKWSTERHSTRPKERKIKPTVPSEARKRQRFHRTR